MFELVRCKTGGKRNIDRKRTTPPPWGKRARKGRERGGEKGGKVGGLEGSGGFRTSSFSPRNQRDMSSPIMHHIDILFTTPTTVNNPSGLLDGTPNPMVLKSQLMPGRKT